MSGADIAVDALDGAYETWGTLASYVPPGGSDAAPCTILRGVADRVFGSGNGAPLMQSDQVFVRKTEILAPEKNGIFTLSNGVTLTVLSDPRCEDDFALEWVMTVAQR